MVTRSNQRILRRNNEKVKQRIIFLCGVSFQEETTACVGRCEVQESADHLLITCSHFDQLWMQIWSWFGFSLVDTYCAQDHFHQFGHLGGFPRQTRQFLKLIWLTCAWTIWKERNNQIFNNKALSLHQLLNQVKLLFYLAHG